MLHCDWCGKRIEEADFATIKPGGTFKDGRPIRLAARTYHTSYGHSGEDRPYEDSCFSQALKLLEGSEFGSPEAGMRWKLVPASEVQNRVYNDTYTEPALGTTPLAELDLTDHTYKRVTGYGIFTVEHLVDARLRGNSLALRPKSLAKLDATLLERGLLPGDGEKAEVA